MICVQRFGEEFVDGDVVELEGETQTVKAIEVAPHTIHLARKEERYEFRMAPG
jgi:hypothetical protein